MKNATDDRKKQFERAYGLGYINQQKNPYFDIPAEFKKDRELAEWYRRGWEDAITGWRMQ